MGALADLQSQALTFGDSSPLSNWIKSELAKRVDAAVPAAFDVINAVHNLAEDTVDHTGGDFTLTITIRQPDGKTEQFTTAAIAFSASAATIESAIDTAATSASITGWTNGDISVAGGNLQTADVTLTFDGNSVSGENHPITVFNDSMTGGTSPSPRVTVTTEGQSKRAAWAVMNNLGIITGTPPAQTAVASTSAVTKGADLVHVPDVIVKALMREAAAEDHNNGSYFSLEAALYTNDRAPLAEQRLAEDEIQ